MQKVETLRSGYIEEYLPSKENLTFRQKRELFDKLRDCRVAFLNYVTLDHKKVYAGDEEDFMELPIKEARVKWDDLIDGYAIFIFI